MQRRLAAFLRSDTTPGILLVAAAIVAMVLDNSSLSGWYDGLLATKLSVAANGVGLSKPLLLWINDGLMAVFFLLVGLEIKEQMLEGELSSPRKAILPGVAALGGMIVPALIFAALNWNDAAALRGWAIPSATDIAFSLGVLALLGSRVPLGLKVFLTAVAVLDDLGAIVIIAAFYTADLSTTSLVLAAICIAVLIVFNWLRVMSLAPYILVGLVLWVCVLKSGVHATLAGVVLAFTIPLRDRAGARHPLHDLATALKPWVNFFILPVFAFANAGVSLGAFSFETLLNPVALGIAAGLFLGKQIGILGFSFLAIRSGLCPMPQGATWLRYYGIALLCGIGFTMSLFIGTLAYAGDEMAALVRVGVIAGSLASAICGYLVLRFFSRDEMRRPR